MKVLFKRHSWVVHCLFILALVWLLMRTANELLETALLPLPEWHTAGMVQLGGGAATALSLERTARALGFPPPRPAEPEVLNSLARTALRVKLLGTLVCEGAPEWSVASIQDTGSLKSGAYMVGDQIQGGEIIDIQRLRVIIINNNRREFIDGTPGARSGGPPWMGPAISSRPAVESGVSPRIALGAGVKQLSDNHYEVPRMELDRVLANLNDVAMQGHIMPHFKHGVVQGFKLFSIRPDSVYSKIGVQNGDVIRRINGFDMNSAEKVLEIYTRLKESSRIEMEVDRNGSLVRKTYQIM